MQGSNSQRTHELRIGAGRSIMTKPRVAGSNPAGRAISRQILQIVRRNDHRCGHSFQFTALVISHVQSAHRHALFAIASGGCLSDGAGAKGYRWR